MTFLRDALDKLVTGMATTITGVTIMGIGLVLWLIYPWALNQIRLYRIKTPHSSDWFFALTKATQNELTTSCGKLLQRGFSDPCTRLIRLHTPTGHLVVAAPDIAEEIHADARLSGGQYTKQQYYTSTPGLEPLDFTSRHRDLLRDVVSRRLNKKFDATLHDTPQEINDVLERVWTNKSDWHEIEIGEACMSIVVQASLRTIVGPELSHDASYSENMMEYVRGIPEAVSKLRKYPRILLPFVHWFLPELKQCRERVRKARERLQPTHEARMKSLEKNQQERTEDLQTWFMEVSQGREYDPLQAQLSFAAITIHATADCFSQMLVDLTQRPELVDALREELVQTLRVEGWRTSSFSRLVLMDSVFKESQRLKPLAHTFLKSVVMAPIMLSDGTIIPKGAVAVSTLGMRDPGIYSDPDTFNGYRFLDESGAPGLNSESRGFSSVSPYHLGFGYGKHSCPGRFFVSLQLKIMLSYVLLRYDWRLADDKQTPRVIQNGFDQITNPKLKLQIKRRQEEVDLNALAMSR